MDQETTPAAGRWRRRTFRIWVAVTIVLALAIALVLPWVQGERLAFLVATPIPLIEIGLLALGLGWLIWLVLSGGKR